VKSVDIVQSSCATLVCLDFKSNHIFSLRSDNSQIDILPWVFHSEPNLKNGKVLWFSLVEVRSTTWNWGFSVLFSRRARYPIAILVEVKVPGYKMVILVIVGKFSAQYWVNRCKTNFNHSLLFPPFSYNGVARCSMRNVSLANNFSGNFSNSIGTLNGKSSRKSDDTHLLNVLFAHQNFRGGESIGGTHFCFFFLPVSCNFSIINFSLFWMSIQEEFFPALSKACFIWDYDVI
jgi:hypothetical protein